MTRPIPQGIRAGVRRLFVLALRTDRRSRRDLRAEVDAHIEERVEYLVARGVSPAAARSESVLRFGGNLQEAIALLESSAVARDRRLSLSERVSSFAQDARFIFRGLRRAPSFSAGIVATFALGLGVNSAVFRVADRVLMRAPAGVGDPWSLRRANAVFASTPSGPTEGNTVSYPQARLISESRAFTRATTYANARGLHLEDGRELAGVYVDSGYFALLNMNPATGRFFAADEAEPGAEIPVAVVSYDYWRRELGGASLAELPLLKISGRAFQVVGVTPRGFVGLDLDPVDVWLPLGVAALGRGAINGTPIPWYRMNMMHAMHVVGRIAPAENDGRAGAQASAAIASLNAEISSPVRSIVMRSIVAASDVSGGDAPGQLLGRLAAVAVVILLITCANAANLLLARVFRRRREIAIRLALGASRARIVRLLIVESAALGVAGGAAAALAGYWTGDALRGLLFPDGKWTTAAFDDRALWFTLGLALAAGLITGLVPALQFSNPDLVSGLKGTRRESGRVGRGTQATLIVLQVAFSLVLLIASGLLVRSLQQLNAVNMGFEPAGLVTVGFPSAKLPIGASTPPTSTHRFTAPELADRLRRYPGVKSVALASNLPFGSHAAMTVSVPGQPEPDSSAHEGPWFSAVSADFFSVMGTRVSIGRAFNERDVLGNEPVAIVNVAMARLYWRNANPFHSCLLVHGSCAQIVGVVEDIRDTRGGGPAPPRYYLPLSQMDDSSAMFSANALVVRASRERAPQVIAAVKTLFPTTQNPTTELISDRIGHTMRPWRLAALLFLTLGGLALLLASVGTYSVMTFVASERAHELGVRIALGASAGDIVRLVLRTGLRMVGAGAIVGLIAAALVSRLLSSLLFGISPLDPLVYVVAVSIFGATGLLAMIVPAIRVMRTDPMLALRIE